MATVSFKNQLNNAVHSSSAWGEACWCEGCGGYMLSIIVALCERHNMAVPNTIFAMYKMVTNLSKCRLLT